MLSNEERLLQNPLVQALLNKKLSKFFWLVYFSNFLTFFALFIALILFILYVPNPRSAKCKKHSVL